MPNSILWKRLYPNDFNAINGQAAPSGTGGGAMHIVLGTNKAANDVLRFLNLAIAGETVIPTQAGPNYPAAELRFSLNPARANEWRIADQRSHRHPAWTDLTNFPAQYDPSDRPIVMVLRAADAYHVGWMPESEFGNLEPALASQDRGVAEASDGLLAFFGLSGTTALEEFDAAQAAILDPPDPTNVEDARRRIFAEILRRQGQGAFRAALLDSFDGRCAVTGYSTPRALEAAHISPYRGPETNHASNGILLRADVHTLFDLGLISVDPTTLTICVSATVNDEGYRALHGTKLRSSKTKLSVTALEEHFARFLP